MGSDKKTEKRSWQQGLVLYIHDLIYMLIVVMLLFLVVFRVIVVTQDSMFSTLWDGDYLLLVSELFCGEPKQGDIVVVSKQSFDNGKPIIKRVIATEGQCVDIDFESGTVYVDGVALDEPYLHQKTNNEEGTVFPLTVGEDCIFVLGDNRSVSLDSRSPQIGQIDRREVLGKAVLLMLPGTHHGQYLPDYGRIGFLE
ncbi:MAG: signal peptidase I [Candidatus Faecousia sp.]|nr:signal peptidase I [Candidatus Faecousia sp.]